MEREIKRNSLNFMVKDNEETKPPAKKYDYTILFCRNIAESYNFMPTV
jgi:hypothetical protein